MYFKLLITCVSVVFLLTGCQSSKTKKDSDKKASDTTVNQNQDQATQENLDVQLPEAEDVQAKSGKEPTRQSLKKLMEANLGAAKDTLQSSAAMPDFQAIKETNERKKRFVQFLKPVIETENSRILQDRYLIKRIYAGVKNGDELSDKDRNWLKTIAKKYRVKNREFPSNEAFLDLLMHVDIIPLDLALAQAANESAWGTSRFARMGNNMFGQWCFKPGCGIVPAQRKEGATHEVASFITVAGSVESYMHHVNSHPAYQKLRVLRYEQRLEGKSPDGHRIALGLQKYSGIGMKYVNILRSMMEKQEPYL